jgi:DNA-binding transcriptional regulator YiaG
MTSDEVRDIRIRLGVSQERFAAMLGTTVVSVNRWENGKASPSRLYIREIKNLEVQDGAKIR